MATSVKILYIDMCNFDFWDEYFRELLEAYKNPSTNVEVTHLQTSEEPLSPFLPPKPYYYADLFKTIARAEEKGFDAVIIGCAADPGLREARQMASIPVLAPLTSALHVAGLLGRRLAVLCPAKEGKRDRPLTWHEDTIRMSGFLPNQVVFRLVEVEKPQPFVVEELIARGDYAKLREEILRRYQASIYNFGIKQARLAVEEEGADVVFFACTLWGGMLDSVANAVSVPVLDPVITTLKVAECVAAARVARSINCKSAKHRKE